MSYFRNGDLVQAVNTGETLRFGAGQLIPYTSGQSYAQDILDQIGRDVGALEWDWPPAYDGEVRRAIVRHRDEVLRRASYALFFGVDHPNAHFKIDAAALSAVSP